MAADAAIANDIATAPSQATDRRGAVRTTLRWLWSGGLLVVLTFLVIYPVSMLLLGALTNTNPVVDGFGVFDLSLANFITVLGNPNVHRRARQFADRLRRRHGARGRHRADVLLGRGAHQHAVQAASSRPPACCRCSCRRWSRRSRGRSSPRRRPACSTRC